MKGAILMSYEKNALGLTITSNFALLLFFYCENSLCSGRYTKVETVFFSSKRYVVLS